MCTYYKTLPEEEYLYQCTFCSKIKKGYEVETKGELCNEPFFLCNYCLLHY